jgi:hypothetical protein
MNSEGKNSMSVKGLRAPSLALAYEDWTMSQAIDSLASRQDAPFT